MEAKTYYSPKNFVNRKNTRGLLWFRNGFFFSIMANIGVHVNFWRAVQFIKQEFFKSFCGQWLFTWYSSHVVLWGVGAGRWSPLKICWWKKTRLNLVSVGEFVRRAPDQASGSRKPWVIKRAFARGVPSALVLHFRMKWALRTLWGLALFSSTIVQTSFSKNDRSSFLLASRNCRRSARDMERSLKLEGLLFFFSM